MITSKIRAHFRTLINDSLNRLQNNANIKDKTNHKVANYSHELDMSCTIMYSIMQLKYSMTYRYSKTLASIKVAAEMSTEISHMCVIGTKIRNTLQM